jgi:hypothetical protein
MPMWPVTFSVRSESLLGTGRRTSYFARVDCWLYFVCFSSRKKTQYSWTVEDWCSVLIWFEAKIENSVAPFIKLHTQCCSCLCIIARSSLVGSLYLQQLGLLLEPITAWQTDPHWFWLAFCIFVSVTHLDFSSLMFLDHCQCGFLVVGIAVLGVECYEMGTNILLLLTKTIFKINVSAKQPKTWKQCHLYIFLPYRLILFFTDHTPVCWPV